MASLQERGITSGDDANHTRVAEAEQLQANAFFDRAAELLEAVSDDVLADIVPNLEHYEGRWHPNGFMVFQLGVTPDGSSLRLHIWPRGERHGAEWGTTIHDHAWHLASRVLAGTYTDRLVNVDLTPSGDEVRAGLLRVYQAGYGPDGQQGLVTDGRYAAVELSEPRVVPAGRMHTIEAGVYHSTTIGDDELAATLILDSPKVIDGPNVLMDAPSGEPIYATRPAISEADKLRAKDQVLAFLGMTTA